MRRPERGMPGAGGGTRDVSRDVSPSPNPQRMRETREICNTFTFRINSLELRLQTDYTLTLHKLMAEQETQELMSIGTESQ